MKKLLLLTTFLLFAVVVYATRHPVEMEGKTCDTCHNEGATDENKADAEAYKQWKTSSHALGSVTCITCHKDEANFKPTSALELCASCHSVEVSTLKGKDSCSSCHTVHSFVAKKDSKLTHKVLE